MLHFLNKKNRFASFTFDDGFIQSAEKINDLIQPYKATFYIVTGWVYPNNEPIEDEYNLLADHGNTKRWHYLADEGHEIGSHTVSHNNNLQSDEYFDSFNFIKRFGPSPYSLATPYGDEAPAKLPYDTIRFCEGKKIYNSLCHLDLIRLYSFDPAENDLTIKNIGKIIKKIPSNSWLILRGHGLDNEGYKPWTSQYLKDLLLLLVKNNFEIKNIREMTNLINKKTLI